MKKLLYDSAKSDPEFIKQIPAKYANADQCLDDIWVGISRTAEYAFNKAHCLDGWSKVKLANGDVITLSDLYKRYDAGEELWIMSMMPNGKIEPGKVNQVIKSGVKELLTIRLANGKSIRATPEHRFLTTDGYKAVKDFTKDEELIFDNESSYAQTSLSKSMKKTQSKITHEERCIHQQNVQVLHPDRFVKAQKAGRAAVNELRKNKDWMSKYKKSCSEGQKFYWDSIEDKKNNRNWAGFTFFNTMTEERLNEWKKNKSALVKARYANMSDEDFDDWMKSVREGKLKSGCVNFGKKTFLSDGRLCDSKFEAEIGQYLIDRGIDFELHKQLKGQGKHKHVACDFYVDGLYIEADGLYRGDDFFKNRKYGDDIPFIVLYPNSWKYTIDEMLLSNHIANGVKVLSVKKEIIPGRWHKTSGMTYDIEMDSHFPANFIANGIVSHNSFAYGMITAIEQYMKYNYPLQFIAASLNTDGNVNDFIKYAIVKGYKVSSPNVNKSKNEYTVNGDTLYMPIWSIDGVGGKAVEEILNNGPFDSYDDYIAKTSKMGGSRKTVLPKLIALGAFDGVDKRDRYELMCEYADSRNETRPQEGAYDSNRIRGRIEQELMGVSLSYDMLLENREWLESEGPQSKNGLFATEVGGFVKVAGEIVEIKKKEAKNGLMAWAKVKLISQEIVNVTIFANSYSRMKDFVINGDLVSFGCRRGDDFRGDISLMANSVFNKSMQEL
jgi:ribosomal protein L24